MDRRRFTFWLGFGLFTLSEKLRVSGLDSLAAAAMRRAEAAGELANRTGAEHWTVAGNENWHWFERENLIKGEWVLTGTTTPVNKQTGVRKPENRGFLDDSLVPTDVRASLKDGIDLVGHQATPDEQNEVTHADHEHAEPVVDLSRQLPREKVRARHGRPPSKWLRSLRADELRVWLRTIEVPEAGVSGMTVWTHLTRDHKFDGAHIKGLIEKEQFKLHAAAHYGY